METYFKVQISYPSGKVEEIEEKFATCAQAKKYGEALLAQIPSNKGYRDFVEQEAMVNPYFFVIEYSENEKKVVYESR